MPERKESKLRYNKLVKRFALHLLHESFFPLILFTLTLILSIQNYTPGTFLSGWDTLHPEFNFSLNLTRTFFGVFRPEQGLGAVAAHAHMVEIPRILVLYGLHFFFPLSMLRYIYIFGCLTAGPIGMYLFLYRILIKKRLPSFLGALFYLLNLGTYQTFVVPFEMFTTLYATLPFIYWLIAEYLNKPKKRLLIWFSISIVLTSPAAYASTLWFIFFISLLIFFIPYVFLNRKKVNQIVRNFILLIILTLLLNLYWILPNLYFAGTQGQQIASANINKLFSEEAFLKNKEFGNIKDILLVKSFYFDWGIYNYKTGTFEQLTKVFQAYIAAPTINTIGYIIATFFLIGFIYTIKTARKYFLSLVFLSLFCLLFLFNANQPFTLFFLFLQNQIPLFKEALRFPDDKILNIFVFLLSILFAYSQLFLTSLLNSKRIHVLLFPLIGVGTSLLLLIYMMPAFAGNLIHPSMRVRIPLEYFSLFDSLSNETGGRVANLPVNSPWGWVYHDWYGSSAPSFQGAGFLYFGTTPSILERDFDRWNPLNEQYYREMSHAVYAKNSSELENVIKKYDITDILLDTSIIDPGSDSKSLYYSEISNLLDKLQKEKFIVSKQNFGNFLTLYKVGKKSLLSHLTSAVSVTPIQATYYKDTLFEKFGDYLSKGNSQLTYPLVGISDNESKITPGIIKTTDTNISLKLSGSKYTLGDSYFAPTNIPTSIVAVLSNNQNQNVLNVSLYPQTPLFDNESLLVPIKGDFEYPNSINAELSVNRQVFPVRNIQYITPTALGTTFLNASSNTVALFDVGSKDVSSYTISDIPLSFGYCQGENNSTLNILARPDSIALRNPQEASVCIKMPLTFVKAPDNIATTLVNLSFNLRESNLISACLTNPTNGTCSEHLRIIKNDERNTISFAINKNDLSSTQLIINVPKEAQQQTLSQLTVTSEQAISETVLTSSFFKVLTPKHFTTITLPKEIDSNYFNQATETTNFTNDCKNGTNIATKQFDKGGQFYRYKSLTGNYCDHISFPNLPHSISYLVYVKSRNIEGLPMNFCITNYTSRKCDIYSKLSKFKNPTNDVFVLPPTDSLGSGYDINFENVGVTGSSAINDYFSVTFIPFSLPLLSGVQTGTAIRQQFSGTLSSESIYNPLLMSVVTKHSPTLISLSYAYNPGFHAYNISCDKGLLCTFSVFLSPIFGKELQHVEISSWKNGWIAPMAAAVTIIFLPQYLEYVGIIILVMTMVILLLLPFMHHIPDVHINPYFEGKTAILKNKIKKLIKS